MLRSCQLAQRIGAHVASIRTSKEPLRVSDIERLLGEVVRDISSGSDERAWDVMERLVATVSNELGAVLPKVRQAVKAGQVVLSE